MTTASAVAALFTPGERSLPALLEKRAQLKHKPLLVCQETTWTGADAFDQAARGAHALAAAGVARGDRVALICGNRIEFFQVFLGCAWLGAVSVPINTASRGFQLQHILDTASPRLIVAEQCHLAALETVDLDSARIERLLVIGTDDVSNVAGRAAEPWKLASSRTEVARLDIGDPLTILFTSGTTGPSKGVVCPHGQFFWYGVYCGAALDVRASDVLHTTLPLFHINALCGFMQALVHDATLVVEPRFSVSRYWQGVKDSGATVVSLLGAMAAMLLTRPESLAERDHRVRLASGPGVPATLHAEFLRRTGILLSEGYASTESNVVISSPAVGHEPGTMGFLVDGFDAIVADANDRPVPDGEAGELLIRAREPFAMALGYFGMPDKTVEAWRNLWFHTGDRVVRDADGRFRFVDRLKDVIRRRGENVSSFEVEEILLRHPAVALAAVFPVPSDLAEEEVMAAIVLREGEVADPEAIVRFCAKHLPYFCVPRFLDIVAKVPRTENGKIQKFRLREQGVTAMTWDRERAGLILRG
ncbi:ATP-dependent acyl-CoA ligase [Sphingopyxis sp. MSC1_008]|jgi:crotonobetaine/carnitine-CoA ligase|uniref:ATP-dependent acyl-CoA ligase n=1 Tax=Sphingopyxis sp. MSC1_008 TaxID=2909265 RepID=UPI0020C0815A|nr:ATP-dependent acyl-CoA ligase [Sphingopyxis sp. MSC1_008]